MSVRKIQRQELLECEKIQSVAFVYSLDTAEFEKKAAEEIDPEKGYLAFVNDENVITACFQLPEYQVRYEGQWAPMVGIGGVASLPEYRFGGAIRQIFQSAFRQMFESGTVFSTLYPFSHSYYRKFGYELCQTTTEYELPVQALSKFRYGGKARMICPGDSIEGLKTVFDAHFLRYNLAIQREDRHWEKLLGKDPYKERIYTYLLEDESGPSAYVVLGVEDVSRYEKAGRVREIAFAHPQGLRDVLGLLYRLAAQYTKLHLSLPEDIPFPALLDESYDVKVSIYEQQMARVIHVQKALEMKGLFEGGGYTLGVRDAVIPENDGVFCVRCESGVVSALKTQEEKTPDLTADVRTLAQLLLGYLSLDEALYKEDVQVHGNLDTLRRVFVKHPVFLTEHF